MQQIEVLATDLDGTFLPLESGDHVRDLAEIAQLLQRRELQLAFVTGRHLSSILAAIKEHQTPAPDWIIGDVGTSIYRRSASGYQLLPAYAEHLSAIVGQRGSEQLKESLAEIDALKLQESEKQGSFKTSYYLDASHLESALQKIEACLSRDDLPYSVIHSIDPFNGVGLIDLLPQGVSKAYALQWWCQQQGLEPTQVVFSGDSGNDSAAFAAGFLSIVVGNAAAHVWEAAKLSHVRANFEDRLYAAKATATSGVLEGLQFFLNRGV